jgi:hypothetical protein
VNGAAKNAPTLGVNGYPEGGNLSGGWGQPDIPNSPTNGTGGLYAADLFLEHVIPEIESSREFKDGGLIDVTFDEGYPPFTYNNSFYNDPLDQLPAHPAGRLGRTRHRRRRRDHRQERLALLDQARQRYLRQLRRGHDRADRPEHAAHPRSEDG